MIKLHQHRKVKALLMEQGISQTELAEELGLRPCTISQVLNGHNRSKKIQRFIADKLKRDYVKLWGHAA